MIILTKNDIIGFICILFITPFFVVLFSKYKADNPYLHKILILGLPISLSYIIRKAIINMTS